MYVRQGGEALFILDMGTELAQKRDQVVGTCKRGSELSGSINCREVLD